MRSLIRLRVFLLCCLLMVCMNVMLIVNGIVTTGSMTGDMDSRPGCAAACMPWDNPADGPVIR
jgi:hypothetical protein